MLERDVAAAAASAVQNAAAHVYRKVVSRSRQFPLKDLTGSTSASMFFLAGTLILGAVAVPATWTDS